MSVAAAGGTLRRHRHRAEWMLFTLHFRRLLPPLAGVYLGLLGLMSILSGATRFHNAPVKQVEAASNVLDIASIVIAVMFALPVGTAVFSRAFKEQQILFFHSLPIGRTRQWLMLVGSSLAAFLVTIAIAFVFRPGAARLMFSGEAADVFATVASGMLLFATGTCFALVFTRPVVVYVAAVSTLALLIPAGALVVIAPFRIYGGMISFSGFAMDPYREMWVNVFVTSVSLLAFTFFACSLYFYVRGEFITMRTQLRNFAIALGAGVAVVLVIVPLNSQLAANRETRTVARIALSESGAFGTAVLRAPHSPWLASVRIVDLARGATTAAFPAKGLLVLFPSRDGVLVVRRDMTLLTTRRSDRVEMYSSAGKLLHTVTFPDQEIVHAAPADGDSTLVVTDDGAFARVYDVRADGRANEVARAVCDQPPSVWLAPPYVLLANRIEERRAWKIRDGRADDVPWAKATSEHPMPTVVRGTAFPDHESVFRFIEREVPLARDAGDSVVYSIPSLWQVRNTDYLWALRVHPSSRLASLYVLPPEAKTWLLVSSSIPLLPDHRFAGRVELADYQFSMLTHVHSNAEVVYIDTGGGKPAVRLYNAATGRTIDVMTVAELDPRMRVTARPGSQGWSNISIFNRTDDVNRVVALGRFVYDGAALRPLPPGVPSVDVWRPDGTIIFALNEGFLLVPPTGPKRIVRIQ